jgi:ABC-type glycerol-3-phosphate transport system substrate-binding protein
MIKRKRGRPKGSKNKPKMNTEPKKCGRPKGSKNKPKIATEPKKRGRPKKIKEPIKSWGDHEGISWVARKRGPQSDTHRWIAVFNNEVIGYYKTSQDAAKAYNENQKTNSKEN